MILIAGVSESETKMKLKLLIDSKANKVVFVEADKDFVDFLFGMLSLSLSAVVQLGKVNGMAGCLGDLYASAEALTQEYLVPNSNTGTIVPATRIKSFYSCFTHRYITDGAGVRCPNCPFPMSYLSYTYVAPQFSSDLTAFIDSGDT